MEKKWSLRKSECVLRLLTIILLVISVCLIAFDVETKALIYNISQKATYKALNALVVVIWVHSAAAIYNFLQLGRCFFFDKTINGTTSYHITIASFCFLLDQVIVYVVFSTNTAGTQASAMAVTGSSIFQWMKLCDRFTRFCFQGAGGLLSGLLACILMVVISSISAYNLFRHFSPNNFLVLKI